MNDTRYRQVASAVFGDVWAILPQTLNVMGDLVRMRIEGERLTAEEIEARIGGRRQRAKQITGKVAVLPVFGVIGHRMNMMSDISGGTSTEMLGKEFDALANDPEIGAILLDVDSPGGSVGGLQELSDKIFNARKPERPIIAVANGMAASAAYYIATAADEVVVTPGSEVGSVGTLALHTETSGLDEKVGIKNTLVTFGENKGEGSSIEPLSDGARADLQRRVDEYGRQFVADVVRNRDVPKKDVMDKFGQGLMYQGKDAVRRGMADRVATLDEMLQGLGVQPVPAQNATRAYKPHPSVELKRKRAHLTRAR